MKLIKAKQVTEIIDFSEEIPREKIRESFVVPRNLLNGFLSMVRISTIAPSRRSVVRCKHEMRCCARNPLPPVTATTSATITSSSTALQFDQFT